MPALGLRLALRLRGRRPDRANCIYRLVRPDAPGAPAELRTRAWGPLEFMAAVDAAGLVRPLVATARSGTAADGFFGHPVGGTSGSGNWLPPGFYRVWVGP